MLHNVQRAAGRVHTKFQLSFIQQLSVHCKLAQISLLVLAGTVVDGLWKTSRPRIPTTTRSSDRSRDLLLYHAQGSTMSCILQGSPRTDNESRLLCHTQANILSRPAAKRSAPHCLTLLGGCLVFIALRVLTPAAIVSWVCSALKIWAKWRAHAWQQVARELSDSMCVQCPTLHRSCTVINF